MKGHSNYAVSFVLRNPVAGVYKDLNCRDFREVNYSFIQLYEANFGHEQLEVNDAKLLDFSHHIVYSLSDLVCGTGQLQYFHW